VSGRNGVVLDRLIRRSWLDAAAAAAARGLTEEEFRAELSQLLEGQLPGDPTHGALGKTKTVLSHIWWRVPPSVRPLRDEALDLFECADSTGRLALHWGMGLATYAFFRDLTTMIGRLLAIQGVASRGQVSRRAAELFGERTTIQRAVPTLIASLREWGVLVKTPSGDFTNQAMPVADPAIQCWLVEAVFRSRDTSSARFDDLVRHPALFPFSLTVVFHDLRDHPRLDVFQFGINDGMVGHK
jgi:hypothetical protein